MSLPLRVLTVTCTRQDGTPDAGATVFAMLDRDEVYDGLVLRWQQQATANGAGAAMLLLFPNELGSRGSAYLVTIMDSAGGVRRHHVVMPDRDCAIEEILDLETVPPRLWSGKIDLIAGVAGNLPVITTAGGLEDSGVAPSELGGGGGVSDHGLLTGLDGDDHPQYHTDARADARYSPLGHDHDADYDAAGSGATAVSGHEATYDHGELHAHVNKATLDAATAAYTTEEQSKLAGVAAGANNYTHPATHAPSVIAQDADNRFVSDAEKSAWNNKTDRDVAAVTGNLAAYDAQGNTVDSGYAPGDLGGDVDGAHTNGACDLTTGNVFTITVSGTTAISLTNVPEDSTAIVTIKIVNGGSAPVYWPVGIQWANGIEPVLSTFGADYVYIVCSEGSLYGAYNTDFSTPCANWEDWDGTDNGEATTIASETITRVSCIKTVNGNLLFVWSTSSAIKAILATYSKKVISVVSGSSATLHAATGAELNLCNIDSTKVLITFVESSPGVPKCAVLTLTDSSINIGTIAQMYTDYSVQNVQGLIISSTAGVFVGQEGTAYYNPIAVPFAISGTIITPGSKTNIGPSYPSYPATIQLTETRFLNVYSYNSGKLYGTFFDVDSGVVTVDSNRLIDDSTAIGGFIKCAVIDPNTLLVFCDNNYTETVVFPVVIDGTTFSVGTEASIFASAILGFEPISVVKIDSTHSAISFRDSGDSDKTKTAIIKLSGTSCSVVATIEEADFSADKSVLERLDYSSIVLFCVDDNSSDYGKAKILFKQAPQTETEVHDDRQDNPHEVTATQVGLGNCDNTADADKPVSTAQQGALDLKADAADLHSHSNKTTLDAVTAAFTSEEKTKLSGIAESANNYAHPASHSPSIITQDSSNRFVTDTEKSTWNAKLGVITASLTLYIATTGSDATGDGSSGSPWATPHKAFDYLSRYRIQAGINIFITCLAGNYAFGSNRLEINHADGAQIYLQGQGAGDGTGDTTQFSFSGQSICISVKSPANIRRLQLKDAGGDCNNGIVVYGPNGDVFVTYSSSADKIGLDGFGSGFYCSGGRGTIRYADFKNFRSHGIRAEAGTYLDAQYVTVNGNSVSGVFGVLAQLNSFVRLNGATLTDCDTPHSPATLDTVGNNMSMVTGPVTIV